MPCCAVGRPFLVEGEARTAGLVPRADWLCENLTPAVEELSLGDRQALARYWQESALMEHASIAAFSRFVLDLLSLGAPPVLVEQATRAMLDETAHAKACFALAGAYSGEACGPSELTVSGSMDRRTLRDIVQSTVLEGCIGETVAALEAAEALEHASDPAVRRALAQIAEDELRHAALAYRFVRWAIERYGASVQSDVEAAFSAAIAEHAALAPAASDVGGLAAHGLLSPAHRYELRGQVLRDLVAPLVPSLLAA
jgi:hypothetical protein